MERLHGPINPSFFGEHLDVECLEQERNALEFSYGQFFNTHSLRFEEEQEHPHFSTTPSLEDKMPFLQMLQSVESPPFSPFTEPNFQTLLRLQHLKKPWEMDYTPEMETQIQALELESCITHDMLEMHSPVKSETKDLQHPHSASCIEGVSSECNQEQPNSVDNSGSSPAWVRPQTSPKQTHFSKSPLVNRERRKRKRTRPTKNKEEVESQRMTHIAVERNRRRQMNEHLNALRSLMPPSYIQRGDQASIIGGAIDFVKELEQLLQSLQAQKRTRKAEECGVDSTGNSSSSSSAAVISFNGLLTSPPVQFRIPSDDLNCIEGGRSDEFTVEKKSQGADIEVTVIQTHVNLKIQCPRRPGQLLRAIVDLEDLRLTVLHLNITSLQGSVLYSFNLKIEDDCKLGSANEIAAAVHQIFNIFNGS